MDKEKIKNFTDLIAWKEGHKLALTVYKTTDNFPKKEIFSLTDQMRRSSVSVTSNIAEDVKYLEASDFHTIWDLTEEVTKLI